MTNRFLMCPPQYFKVNYVINPWMAANVDRVGLSEAQSQWTTLHNLIENLAEVELIDPQPDLPDMPFTANAGLVMGDCAILSNFRYAERQMEARHFERWFHDHGFTVHRLPHALPFEGAGDALLDRERSLIWMGYGYRSERDAGRYIQKLLGLEVVMLELTDPRFYHLDTLFCPLPRGYVMYYPHGFSEDSRALLQQTIPAEKIILVSEYDALNFACNAVNIGSRIILNRASESLVKSLSEAGFQTLQCPFSEFLRAGGASKCLVLRLEEKVSIMPLAATIQ
jgi:N-dimethylarginine dimethylaminohydrolase